MDSEQTPRSPRPLTARQSHLLNRIADYLEAYLAEGKHPLRPKQIDVVRDIIAAARAGQFGGTIIKPTGTGKTVIFSAIVQALQGLIAEVEETRGLDTHGFLILVPTTLLADQAYTTMVKDVRSDGSKLFGFDPQDIAILKSDATPGKKGEALAAKNLIMTYDYFHSLSQRDQEELASRYFTIMDEVDVAKGKKRTPLFEGWTRNHYTLGFSATDTFLDHGELKNISQELFDNASPIHRTKLAKAAEDKEIAPTRNVLFVTDLAPGIERKLRNKKRDFTEQEAADIVNQPGRDAAAIKAIARFVDPHNGIAFKDLNQVWFCMGVKHAARIATGLNAVYQETLPNGASRYPHGYAVAVSGDTPKDDWIDADGRLQLGLTSILAKHRCGEIPVICNADMLIRGFDSPRTQLCVMLRPSCSPWLIEQTGGRIARFDRDNLTKMGYVASFFDRDTESAMCFTDVAGSVYIGPPGGETNTHYRSSNPDPRTPNLERLPVENPVQVITHFEPRDIHRFLQETRAVQRNSMPNNYYTGPRMARELGLPPHYFDGAFAARLNSAYQLAIKAGNPAVSFGGVSIPLSAVYASTDVRGSKGPLIGLERNYAIRVFAPSSQLSRKPDHFQSVSEANRILPKRSIGQFYFACEQRYNALIQRTREGLAMPDSFSVTWHNKQVKIPTKAVGLFDCSAAYGGPKKEIFCVHDALLSAIDSHALLQAIPPATSVAAPSSPGGGLHDAVASYFTYKTLPTKAFEISSLVGRMVERLPAGDVFSAYLVNKQQTNFTVAWCHAIEQAWVATCNHHEQMRVNNGKKVSLAMHMASLPQTFHVSLPLETGYLEVDLPTFEFGYYAKRRQLDFFTTSNVAAVLTRALTSCPEALLQSTQVIDLTGISLPDTKRIAKESKVPTTDVSASNVKHEGRGVAELPTHSLFQLQQSSKQQPTL